MIAQLKLAGCFYKIGHVVLHITSILSTKGIGNVSCKTFGKTLSPFFMYILRIYALKVKMNNKKLSIYILNEKGSDF